MAKRKTAHRGKKSKKVESPQHTLPTGFWSQVIAVLLIVFAVLLVISWFGGGGSAFQWILDAGLRTIGYAVYILPVICIYVAVEVFRAEDNKLPSIMKFASILFIVWFSGLFGLMRQEHQGSTGGVIGDMLNSVMLALVSNPVAIFLYILLIILTSLFITRLSPRDLLAVLLKPFRRSQPEDDANVDIMRKASGTDAKGMSEFKLNAGVPMLTLEDQKRAARSSMRNSVVQDKDAEDKAAMLAVSDPNWKFPSLDILEKKQSPADAGDIQQNAHIIQDTLGEFSIDVEMEGVLAVGFRQRAEAVR